MAIVRKLEPITLEVDANHTEVNCTYSIIVDKAGEKYLQIDTRIAKLVSTGLISYGKVQKIETSPHSVFISNALASS